MPRRDHSQQRRSRGRISQSEQSDNVKMSRRDHSQQRRSRRRLRRSEQSDHVKMPRRDHSQQRRSRRKLRRQEQSDNNSNDSYSLNKRQQSRYDESTQYNNKRLGIKMSFKQKVSDIKNHFRFQNIRVHPEHQQQLIKQLRNVIEQHIGELTHVTKINTKNQNIVQLNLGFKFDSDAYKYLDEDRELLQIQVSKQIISFKPKITQAFRVFIPKLREIIRLRQASLRQQKQREKQKQRLRQEQQRHRRRSRQRQRSYYNPSNNVYSNQRQRQSQDDRLRKSFPNNFSEAQQRKPAASATKKLLFFGVPQFYRQKKLMDIFTSSSQFDFRVVQISFKRITNSVAQYVQVITSQKDAEKLIKSNGILRLEGFPVVIIGSQNLNSKGVLQKLKQFQFIVTFPRKIYPCFIFRQFTTYGKIVQLIALQEIQNGQCSKYSVTISNAQLVKTIIQIGQTSQGIKFQQPERAQMIYRPTRKTVFVPSKLSSKEHQQVYNEKQKDRDYSEEREITGQKYGVEIQY